MGKRSDFTRIDKDAYMTFDQRAYPPILGHLARNTAFYEPCAGIGDLVGGLEAGGMVCLGASDLDPEGARVRSMRPLDKPTDMPITQKDAFDLTKSDLYHSGADVIITNPVWKRDTLHGMIDHFTDLAPTWLLFDHAWSATKQAEPFLKFCVKIVVVGRLLWIPGTTMSGKDDCAWYLFNKSHIGNNTRYYGRS